MKSEYCKQLQSNWDYIVKNININITANHLRESGVLDEDEVDRIKDVNLVSEKRAERMLNMILIRDDTVFLTFMRILNRTGQTKLYDTLESRIADAVAFGELKAQYDQACAHIETIENDLTKTSNHCDFLRNLNRDYKQKVESTQRELTIAKNEASALRKVMSETELELQALNGELEHLQKEKGQQTSIIEGLNNVLKNKGNDNHQNEVLIRDLRKSLNEKCDDISDKNSTIEKLREVLQSKDSDIVKLQRINDKLCDEIRYLKMSLQSSIQQKDKEIAEIRDRLDRRQREISYLRAKLEDLQALVGNIDSLRDKLSESENMRQESEKREQQQKQEIEYLTRKQSDNEIQIKRLWSAVRKVRTQPDIEENEQLESKVRSLELSDHNVPPPEQSDRWANRSAPSILCQAPGNLSATEVNDQALSRGAYGFSPYMTKAKTYGTEGEVVAKKHIQRSVSDGQTSACRPENRDCTHTRTENRKERTHPSYGKNEGRKHNNHRTDLFMSIYKSTFGTSSRYPGE